MWVCGGVGTYMKVRSEVLTFSTVRDGPLGHCCVCQIYESPVPPLPLLRNARNADALGPEQGHCLHDKGFTLLTEPFLQLLMSYLVGCGEIAIFGSSAQGNQQERWALTQMVLDKQT